MTATAPATPQEPTAATVETSAAPATPEVAATPAPQTQAANDASVTPPEAANDASVTVDASRPAVPAPEAKLTAEQAAVVPPESKVKLPAPAPTTHLVGTPMGEAANDPLAEQIEKRLSPFMAANMLPESREGLMVHVDLAKSNCVTAEEGKTGQHDIAITFSGGKLEDPKQAQKVAEQLRAALREHPAFAGMSFGGIDTEIEHKMRCQILALDADQLQALLTSQPLKQATFIQLPAEAANDPHIHAAAATHACTGAACSCKGHKDVAAQAKTEIQSVAPAVTQVAAPATVIDNPAIAAGRVVANEAHAKGAA